MLGLSRERWRSLCRPGSSVAVEHSLIRAIPRTTAAALLPAPAVDLPIAAPGLRTMPHPAAVLAGHRRHCGAVLTIDGSEIARQHRLLTTNPMAAASIPGQHSSSHQQIARSAETTANCGGGIHVSPEVHGLQQYDRQQKSASYDGRRMARRDRDGGRINALFNSTVTGNLAGRAMAARPRHHRQREGTLTIAEHIVAGNFQTPTLDDTAPSDISDDHPQQRPQRVRQRRRRQHPRRPREHRRPRHLRRDRPRHRRRQARPGRHRGAAQQRRQPGAERRRPHGRRTCSTSAAPPARCRPAACPTSARSS